MKIVWILLALAVAVPAATASESLPEWRQKAIVVLEGAIRRGEEFAQNLPEGSPIRNGLEKALVFLREQLDRLKDPNVQIGKRELLKKALRFIQGAISKLPEGSIIRRYLERAAERIRELLGEEALIGGNWKEKAIELLQKAIARLESAIDRLPEGSKLRPILERTLDFLREKLAQLQDASFTLTEFGREEFLRKVLAKLEAAIEKLPENSRLRARLERAAERIRQLLGEEALNGGDWKEKAIEVLQKAIARLESVIDRLPEGSKLRPILERKLNFLREKLEQLQGGAADFSVAERFEFLERLLARLEEAVQNLPEDSPIRAALEAAIQRIRDMLENLQ